MSYIQGLATESALINLFGLTHSTEKDNIEKDIDAWDGKTSISIKTQHTALKTGNLAFEFLLFNSSNRDIRMDSWLRTGEAEEYWFVIGDRVVVFDAQVLKTFIFENKTKWRTTKLTDPERIDENVSQGRLYNQSLCYLIPLKELCTLVEREIDINRLLEEV